MPCSGPVGVPFGRPLAWLAAAMLLFTGDAVFGLPCCAGVGAPAVVGGVGVAVFVALAYERTGGCAGTAACSGDVVPEAEGAALADCAALSGF